MSVITILTISLVEYLRGHEGELIVDAALDDLGVNDEAGGDVV